MSWTASDCQRHRRGVVLAHWRAVAEHAVSDDRSLACWLAATTATRWWTAEPLPGARSARSGPLWPVRTRTDRLGARVPVIAVDRDHGERVAPVRGRRAPSSTCSASARTRRRSRSTRYPASPPSPATGRCQEMAHRRARAAARHRGNRGRSAAGRRSRPSAPGLAQASAARRPRRGAPAGCSGAERDVDPHRMAAGLANDLAVTQHAVAAVRGAARPGLQLSVPKVRPSARVNFSATGR